MENQIELEIYYFASLREKANTHKEKKRFPDGTSLEKIYQVLSKEYSFNLDEEQIQYALNAEYVSKEKTPKQGDVVAFIPPVSGG